MIFTIGAVAFVIGWILMNIFGGKWTYNNADFVGGVFILIGLFLMFVSLVLISWRYLP